MPFKFPESTHSPLSASHHATLARRLDPSSSRRRRLLTSTPCCAHPSHGHRSTPREIPPPPPLLAYRRHRSSTCSGNASATGVSSCSGIYGSHPTMLSPPRTIATISPLSIGPAPASSSRGGSTRSARRIEERARGAAQTRHRRWSAGSRTSEED